MTNELKTITELGFIEPAIHPVTVERIRKRDGRIAFFDLEKVTDAIRKAFEATYKPNAGETAARLAERVLARLEAEGVAVPEVEHVQDVVEQVLMDSDYVQTAKAYILYRAERNRARELNSRLMKTFEEITFADAKDSDVKRENANINGDTAMGSMLKFGSEAAKQFYTMKVLKPDHAKAHREGDFHIHDLDFLTLTTTCCQIDLIKLFEKGFSTGHGKLRTPNSVSSYAALACIAIQSNQNDQHGGQSVANFDYAMAEGVRKSYKKHYEKNMAKALEAGVDKPEELAEKWALRDTDRETYQAMEALIHNLNTMNSRAGAQTPFSSINYGMDTSEEGRMVVRNLLKATMAGLGNGETPIFPIQIFRVKAGVSFNEGDPNYDNFKLAIECSAKRLYPNFAFQDAPYNAKYYKEGHPETEIAYMGCRTRVIGNVHDKDREISFGRGNLSFTTINLPRLGIKARGDLNLFYELLDGKIKLGIEQLLERFEIQAKKTVKNFPFLMGEGVWIDSDKLTAADELREVLKHGSLSLGFIGLAETLTALIGQHHGESDRAQNLGLEIIAHMRNKLDRAAEEYKLNFTLLATPAEGLSGRFVKIDRGLYGNLPGITDRDYYTNSFHIPVHFTIPAFEKIRLEAPYHNLTNAGHISYIEMDGDPSDNLEAFEKVVRYMAQCGVGYGSVNHPVDRDPVCGFSGIIKDVCPGCNRTEDDGVPFERIRRVTGYIGKLDRFNNGKRAEEKARLKHS
ncbi:MAG: anaerobic ribonucleoside triphosphate reductase [Oscillospiraceae bacterium]|jgi:ribonucleoside-triphosphate reductase|nr:anaerobic ribonucleoside triphosphate reductase [Oscillospiraceae bacterium]